jgi:hypothetical protein
MPDDAAKDWYLIGIINSLCAPDHKKCESGDLGCHQHVHVGQPLLAPQ